jgi:chemotaxis signal transduction protein
VWVVVLSLVAVNQERTRTNGHGRFLLVRSGSLTCALPASEVVRVVRRLNFHPVPGSQPRLLGLAQYGGEPLPVLDLHALIERTSSRSRQRPTVILGRGRKRGRSVVGLAVDEVLRVAELDERPDLNSEAGIVAATGSIDGQSVLVLNTGRLLDCGSEDSGVTDV